MDIKQVRKIVICAVSAVAVVSVSSSLLNNQPSQSPQYLQYDRFIQEVKQGKIEKVSLRIDRSEAIIKNSSGETFIVKLPPDDRLMSIISENVKRENIYILPREEASWLRMLASLAIPFSLLATLSFLLYRSRGSRKSHRE